MLIDYITSRASAGAEVAYPLLLFRRDLASAGLQVRIKFTTNYAKRERKPDVIIISLPYFRDQYPSNSAFRLVSDSILKKAFESTRKFCEKIIFFETSDSTASSYLNYLPYVDLMLKWQILSEKGYYCNESYSKRPHIWVEEPQNPSPKADPAEIHKLQVGWNLAYRNYSLLRRGGRHFHWRGLTWNPKFTPVSRHRPLLTFFRGELTGHRGTHRQASINAMVGLNHPDIMLGMPISRRRYLNEIRKSKAVVSPFGYGEPCYRDMEAFIHGAILVKPSMAHLETFPDMYREQRTYIPVDWQFNDLPSVLTNISENYLELQSIADEGQKLYKAFLTEPKRFVDQLRKIVGKVLYLKPRSGAITEKAAGAQPR